ncbi:MAG: thioredoxin family protein [Pseudomonadota bacterium]
MRIDTPLCDYGWPAPDFTLAAPDGTRHNMRDHLGSQGLVIAFICNHCPYVKAIADRLSADAKVLIDEGFGVLAVMSNDYHAYPEDAPEKMVSFAQRHGFSFPYLIDEDQSVARAYGAVCTPDFFGFDAQGGLQYRGRLDDAKMGDASQRAPELLSAMREVAQTGHGPQMQTPSMGCSIKWR